MNHFPSLGLALLVVFPEAFFAARLLCTAQNSSRDLALFIFIQKHKKRRCTSNTCTRRSNQRSRKKTLKMFHTSYCFLKCVSWPVWGWSPFDIWLIWFLTHCVMLFWQPILIQKIFFLVVSQNKNRLFLMWIFLDSFYTSHEFAPLEKNLRIFPSKKVTSFLSFSQFCSLMVEINQLISFPEILPWIKVKKGKLCEKEWIVGGFKKDLQNKGYFLQISSQFLLMVMVFSLFLCQQCRQGNSECYVNA